MRTENHDIILLKGGVIMEKEIKDIPQMDEQTLNACKQNACISDNERKEYDLMIAKMNVASK